MAGAAVVVTAGVVAVATFAIGGGPNDGHRGTTTWNAIALVSRANGAVRVLDEDGEEITTIRGTGRVEAVHASGDRLALVGATQIALVGVDGDEPIVLPIAEGSTVRRVATNRSLTLVVAPAGGGNLTLIDATNGSQLDVGDLAEQTSPMLLADSIRAANDGKAFAIGDGRNFQTVVVRFGRTDATFFPDVPMAVGDDLVVTSQTVGSSAELGLFDAEGERLASIATEGRPIGGVIDGERFVFVGDSGAIFAVTADDDEPSRLGAIALPVGDVVQSVWPALAGSRLVVSGAQFQAIVDLDGTTLFQTTFTTATELIPPSPTWQCAPVGGSGVFTSLVDLATGDSVAELRSADVTALSSNGCGVQLDRNGGRSIVTPIGSTVLPAAVRTAWIAPDASAAVLVDIGTGDTLAELRATDVSSVGGDGCGVQLTRGGGHFIVTPNGSTVLPASVSTAWIAPDASAAVLVDTGSAASLVRLGNDDGDDADDAGADDIAEPVALGDVDGLVAFLDR